MDSCANCKNYLPTLNASAVSTNQHGLCRGALPVVIMANDPTGTFPGVRADWWCAEHEEGVEIKSAKETVSAGFGGWQSESQAPAGYVPDPINGGFMPGPETTVTK